MDQSQSPYKEALLRKRGEILAAGGGVKPLTTSMETNSRQGDLADQASGNNEVHIQLKLKQTDAKILQAMDAGLHHLQGKTKRVKATELLEFLRQFHKHKLTMLQRHVASARYVSDYDFNNTYQYVIAREEMHVTWAADAILDMGGQLDDVAEPEISVSGKGEQAQRSVIAHDRDDAQAFGDKWGPLVEALTHARHRTMLNVILGETLEHKRFFEQALAGRTDLLGRRADGAGTGGGVLPTRWIEQ
jgi:hypothetical protein